MHLLVIEDERALCETIVRSLRRLAYSVDYRAGDSGMRADRQPMAIPMWVATTCA